MLRPRHALEEPLRPLEAYPLEVLLYPDVRRGNAGFFGASEARIRCSRLGTLELPSGRLCAHDPMIASASWARFRDDRALPDRCTVWRSELELQIPGEVVTTRRFTAAIAASFASETPIARWVLAERIKSTYFPVDSSLFALMDASAVAVLEKATRADSAGVYGRIHEAIATTSGCVGPVVDTPGASGEATEGSHLSAEGSIDSPDASRGHTEGVALPPMFACTSGYGDGFYGCWWGESRAGETVALLVNFDLFDTIEQMLQDGPPVVGDFFDQRIKGAG